MCSVYGSIVPGQWWYLTITFTFSSGSIASSLVDFKPRPAWILQLWSNVLTQTNWEGYKQFPDNSAVALFTKNLMTYLGGTENKLRKIFGLFVNWVSDVERCIASSSGQIHISCCWILWFAKQINHWGHPNGQMCKQVSRSVSDAKCLYMKWCLFHEEVDGYATICRQVSDEWQPVKYVLHCNSEENFLCVLWVECRGSEQVARDQFHRRIWAGQMEVSCSTSERKAMPAHGSIQGCLVPWKFLRF